MGHRTCDHPGCPEPHRALGFCDKHYQRLKKYGSTESRRRPSIEERFWSKVDASGVCWEWAASTDRKGYGQFMAHNGALVRAHRWAYINLCGLIPGNLPLDHLCRNSICVNPDHLEPVTLAENIRRGGKGENQSAKTQCKKGHPYAGENLLFRSNGWRRCRACEQASARRSKLKRKSAARLATVAA